jgi:hypothetical protein
MDRAWLMVLAFTCLIVGVLGGIMAGSLLLVVGGVGFFLLAACLEAGLRGGK